MDSCSRTSTSTGEQSPGVHRGQGLKVVPSRSVKSGLPAGNIDQGLEVTRNISTQANNAIHLSLVEERSRSSKFGELVLQELFLSQESHRQVYKERRVFLFQRALLITKRRRREESEAYAVKDQLMVRSVAEGCGRGVWLDSW